MALSIPTSPGPSISPTKIQSPSPHKSWRVRQSPGGTINPQPPSPIKAELVKTGIQGDVIYRWQHEDTGRRYVGSSLSTDAGNTLFKRLCSYKHHFNDQGKKRRPHIVNAIRRSPTKFTLKIIDHRPNITEENLLQLEETYQDSFDTRTRSHGYNHSRPTKERLRSKRHVVSNDSVPTPQIRKPSARKAADIARKKINEISKQL